MSQQNDDLAYGHYNDSSRGFSDTSRGLSDTFKKFYKGHPSSSQPGQPAQPYNQAYNQSGSQVWPPHPHFRQKSNGDSHRRRTRTRISPHNMGPAVRRPTLHTNNTNNSSIRDSHRSKINFLDSWARSRVQSPNTARNGLPKSVTPLIPRPMPSTATPTRPPSIGLVASRHPESTTM